MNYKALVRKKDYMDTDSFSDMKELAKRTLRISLAGSMDVEEIPDVLPSRDRNLNSQRNIYKIKVIDD